MYEQIIKSLVGEHGYLKNITFEDNEEFTRKGGFVTPQWIQASTLGQSLGCLTNGMGGIITDGFGRTNIKGIYATGDTSVITGVNTDLTQEDF